MKDNLSAVIVDYEVGNVRSVENAFRRLGLTDIKVSKSPDDIRRASFVVLPGVGAFGDAMRALKKDGLVDILGREVVENKKPLLAICVGMQILFEHSEEGDVSGLGWIPGKVVKFQIPSHLTIPHFGWNDVVPQSNEWLFADMPGEKNFYFAHSFHARTDRSHIVAACDYGGLFPAVVRKDNIIAAQFHPEKSHRGGSIFLRNYVRHAVGKERC
jgi:glutamine amidotransferase